MLFSRPLVCWNGLCSHHSFVQVDYSESSCYHHLQLFSHEIRLLPNPPLSVGVIDLGVPDLLLPDVVSLVDGAILGDGDLPIRPLVEELSSSFSYSHSNLLKVGLLVNNPGYLLLR